MSFSRDDILRRITEVMVEQFEVDAQAIRLDAALHDDLDIDSIDAVDLMIELKSFTERKVAIKDFEEVKTVGDIVDVVYQVVMQEGNAAED